MRVLTMTSELLHILSRNALPIDIVGTDRRATDQQICRLAAGVTITTVAQRDGKAKPLTAPTRACVVERADSASALTIADDTALVTSIKLSSHATLG